MKYPATHLGGASQPLLDGSWEGILLHNAGDVSIWVDDFGLEAFAKPRLTQGQ